MDLDPKTDLSFTRTLPISPSVVWTCWTTPEHIMQFFVPRPNLVTACDIDLKVGGRFNTTFDVEGNVMENKGIFLDLIENSRIVFSDAFTEGWKPNPEPFMTAIIDLAPDGNGGTQYTATARHRSEESRKMHEDMGFYVGWGIVVDQLVEYAQTL
jgi:uncharacterized protein YndB with AHSA1/START domain